MPNEGNIRILIVDDMPEKHIVYQTILEELGDELVFAKSGTEALKHVLHHDFAVILLDVNMPGMDGFETASVIRGRRRCAHTPIIFITALADEMHAIRGYELGAVDYILSPVIPAVLRTKVRVFSQLFRLSQQVKQNAAVQVARAERDRAKLADALDRAPDLFAQVDRFGAIRSVNAAGLRMLSLPASSNSQDGVTYRSLWSDAEAYQQAVEAAIRDGLWFGETSLRSGVSELPVSQVILAHQDDHGTIESLSVFARDIGERKRTEAELVKYRNHLEDLVAARTSELEASHEKLRATDRLASIGTLAAGLGHDMGNLLLPLMMRIDALRSLHLPEGANEHLRAIDTAVDYLRRLSQGLRLFALDPLEEDEVEGSTDLASWWHDVRPFLRNALPRTVTLQAELPENPPPIAMPPHRFAQIIFNLVQNAAESMQQQKSGCVRISAARTDDGRALEVSVTDDGPGMTKAVRDRCMEPFFTTKTRGISTGLGLALVHGAVSKSNGAVHIETSLGCGTTFRLILPVVQQPSLPSALIDRRPAACIDVRDARMAAFIALVLKSLRFDVLQEPWHAQLEADLVVVDGRNGYAEGVRSFLNGGSTRQAVIIGGDQSMLVQQGVWNVEADAPPATVRSAIVKAVKAVTSDLVSQEQPI